MPRKQIWSGAVLAAVAASSLTGCSLQASDGTPQSFAQLSSLSAKDAIQAATRAVTAHPSAKVHTVLVAPTATETDDVVATFDEHPTLQGTMAMSSGDPSAQPQALPMRFADDVMYVQMGNDPLLAAQMNGKQWMKMDLQAMAADPNTANFGADVLENTSPTKGLTLLAAAQDLHAVGTEQRGGVQTVHYSGAVSGADATDPNIAGRTGLTQDQADVVGNALGQGVVTKLAYDVWLRADGLPVAMTFTESTSIGSMTGEIDYSDWGTKVTVTPIPDSQSADFVAIMKQEEAASQASQDGSGTPSAPASSDGSGPSGAPSSPSTPSTPGTPSAPGTPSSPTTPSAPTTPGTPSVPNTPSVPSTPAPTGTSSTAPASPTSTGASSSASSSAA
ncbi:hypothetical protein ABH920_007399 [Catenulispora sp. EB89]|uniref:hypothetical protein n=1 Tax=Catenulispora sp. EB89 TaxID=3156257 RepID=UPI003511AA65